MRSYQLYQQAFGDYQTNCYILQKKEGEIIIDPGIGASEWVNAICKNPLAILNTHGHFDHIWSNATLKQQYPHIPIVIHTEDSFMLQQDCFSLGQPICSPTLEITQEEKRLEFDGFSLQYIHFPGHTPGCCVIVCEDSMFSGDFIFYRSIGRYDFPYSSAKQMQESLQKFKQIAEDKILYPGHGQKSSIFAEQKNIDLWIRCF
ncbi:MBL fold metallo-hydrolase [Helicobacter monodelphidis]|uniref:MBL fold metallo-hydrolase n=1 Tax=Helicobacter sp. 15-1451 TaxID=2004995 RepID=UPI000DCCEA70|nr:MBL fold metallo-hydrolase [Helicobacter sp. 15-1451]RAX57512.1 MBL fold metallo-hydrolase [Helicobacter sp. 15-1451]